MFYRTILIDPPYYERGAGKIKRGADKHYSLLKEEEMIRTIVNCKMFNPASNSHLYLWVTNNFLKSGLHILEAIGFRYITNIVWVKDRIGLGQYFRGQHELCLFGVRGKLLTRSKSIPTVIYEPKRKHSQKPLAMYRLIEEASYEPRLEMFARNKRDGWDSWGNEI